MNGESQIMQILSPSRCTAICLLSTLFASGAFAAGFEAETFTVEPHIAPGPNVLVNEASWEGASQIHVYGQEDLTYKGQVSLGLTSQFIPSADGKKIYAFSDYMTRYTYGDIESVLQVFDINTLSVDREIIIPNKVVKAIGMDQLITASFDEKYLYVQNATPATSVTVVELATGEVVSEIPTPGCYGIMPSLDGYRFSSLYGGGAVKTFSLDDSGYEVTTSDKIFDVDTDPLYLHSQRRKTGELVMTSFNGNLYLLDDSGDKVVLTDKIPVTEGIDGDWAPGGYGITAYNGANDVVFMIMHSGATEGSHKDASEEIWAFSLAEKKLLGRYPAEGLVAIDVSQDDNPVVFGVNENDESIDQYSSKTGLKGEYVKTAADERAGWSTNLTVIP